MKQQINTQDAPNASHIYSQAIVSNRIIFVAGQIHNAADGVLVEGETKEKLAQIMKNITNILRSADANLSNIVKVSIFVTDIAQLQVINEQYPSYFTAPLPAREAVCVKELPLGASIEISVIATK